MYGGRMLLSSTREKVDPIILVVSPTLVKLAADVQLELMQ